jgi:hypothetical protein
VLQMPALTNLASLHASRITRQPNSLRENQHGRSDSCGHFPNCPIFYVRLAVAVRIMINGINPEFSLQ